MRHIHRWQPDRGSGSLPSRQPDHPRTGKRIAAPHLVARWESPTSHVNCRPLRHERGRVANASPMATHLASRIALPQMAQSSSTTGGEDRRTWRSFADRRPVHTRCAGRRPRLLAKSDVCVTVPDKPERANSAGIVRHVERRIDAYVPDVVARWFRASPMRTQV